MRNAPGAFALDFRWARRSFDRAADSYDGAAVLRAQIREEHLARLDLISLTPQVVLDAGSGPGLASRAFPRRYPKSMVIALDFSERMLRSARRQRQWLRPFERVCAAAGATALQGWQHRSDALRRSAAPMVRPGTGFSRKCAGYSSRTGC